MGAKPTEPWRGPGEQAILADVSALGSLVVNDTEETDPLELYDQLRMQGMAPSPDEFAARFPHHPDLRARITELEKLRSELNEAMDDLASAITRWPKSVGGYRLLRKIGQGGMGAVFEGEDDYTGRRVAVKLIRSASVKAHARFERESRLAAELSHPALATVYDYGVEDNRAFLVCELIEGRSFKQMLEAERDPLSPEQPIPSWAMSVMGVREVTRALLPVVDALAHIHTQDIVHRDVKPSNILETREGTKLIDFGLAIHRDIEDDRVTRTGMFVGSHNYAAPEQLRGDKERIGPWTDVYALGATLFELYTGQMPFSYPTYAARAFNSHAKPAREPRDINPDVPRRLNRLVMKALSPKVRKRFHDGGELAAAIRKAL